MEPLILIVNSHQLTDYQDCEEKYQLGTVLSLEAKETKLALTKGTLWHLAMARWYQARLENNSDLVPEKYDKLIKIKLDIGNSILASKLTMEVAALIYKRFMEYCNHWDGEQLTPIAVEGLDENGRDRTGFSKLLDEGPNYQIILEGKPDLIATCENNKKYWIDHKTQAKAFDQHPYGNQFMAYTWGMGMPGKINYTVLIKNANDKTYRRQLIVPDRKQIEQWLERTKVWTRRIIKSLLENSFVHNPASCETRYGMCFFNDICKQTNENGRDWVIKSAFKKREERYSSWR